MALAAVALTLGTACFPTVWDHTVVSGPATVTLRHAGLTAETRGTGEAAYAPFNLDGASQGFFIEFTLPDSAGADSAASARLRFRFDHRPGVGRYDVGVANDSTDVDEYVSATITRGQTGAEWTSGVGVLVVARTEPARNALSGSFKLRFVAVDRLDTLLATGMFALTTHAPSRRLPSNAAKGSG